VTSATEDATVKAPPPPAAAGSPSPPAPVDGQAAGSGASPTPSQKAGDPEDGGTANSGEEDESLPAGLAVLALVLVAGAGFTIFRVSRRAR
jgi:hypothetical protein